MHECVFHHKKALSTNRELHWSNAVTQSIKRKALVILTNWQKKKILKKCGKLCIKSFQKKIKTVPSSSDGPTASCLNGFFTSISDTLSSHFDCSTLPKVLTPKVNHDFVLEDVSSSFVRKELLQMNSSEATGLDGISARLLKDAAS